MFKPNVTVACVVRAQHQFLLVEESIEGELQLNQPAGHLELGESLLQAARRELLEETGLNLAPQFLVGTYLYTLAGKDLTFLRFCFGIELQEICEAHPQDPDILRCHWLSEQEIYRNKARWRSPLVGQCLRDFQQGARFALEQLHYLA